MNDFGGGFLAYEQLKDLLIEGTAVLFALASLACCVGAAYSLWKVLRNG
jgi:hypothetical protein